MSMPLFKSVLVVVTDPFARKQPALAKAAAIARRSGARLSLFNSFMVPQPVVDVPMDSQAQIIASATRQRLRRLRELAAGLRLGRVKCVVRWDYPAHEAIVREVLASKPDLLVTDSHRRGRLARLLLSNTDWELIRACPCPLWFVRSAALPKPLQVLVAVDPRHSHDKPARLDDRLLEAADTSIGALGGRMSIMHAYEAPIDVASRIPRRPARLQKSSLRDREFIADTHRAVARLAARHGLDTADCIVQEGPTLDVVEAAVRSGKADLLVMGAVSRSRLSRPVIGNTAEAVIDHVDCDILVVKPARFKSPVQPSRTKN